MSACCRGLPSSTFIYLFRSCPNLNYVILSLKITSSSALFILLPYAFLFMWFWELLCVLFLLLSVRFGVENY